MSKYQAVLERIENGDSRQSVLEYIKSTFKVKESRAREIYNMEKGKVESVLIECDKGYVWNSTSREYIVYIKEAGKNVIVPELLHKNLMKAYVDDMPVDEMAVKFRFPVSYIVPYKTVFGWRRRGVALTDEEVTELSVEECSDRMMEEKKFEIIQEFHKKSWRDTAESARKWEEFQAGAIDPFGRFLEDWKPVYKPYTPIKKKGKHNLIVVLSDCHYGCASNNKHLFRKKAHNTDRTVRCIKEYYQRILDDIKNFNLDLDSITILSAGDQVHTNSPFGTTTKGTPVKSDYLGEEMFEIAFDSVTEFVYNLSQAAPKTRVIALKGNHSGQLDIILFKTVSVFFKDQKNISFDLISAPATTFRERNTFCVATHGAHDTIKAKLPTGAKGQSYLQSMIIYGQEGERGIKSRIALSGDLHHQEVTEYNDFTHYLCPSIVSADDYSDGLGLSSNSAQVALLVDDVGVKMTLNYTFDD